MLMMMMIIKSRVAERGAVRGVECGVAPKRNVKVTTTLQTPLHQALHREASLGLNPKADSRRSGVVVRVEIGNEIGGEKGFLSVQTLSSTRVRWCTARLARIFVRCGRNSSSVAAFSNGRIQRGADFVPLCCRCFLSIRFLPRVFVNVGAAFVAFDLCVYFIRAEGRRS